MRLGHFEGLPTLGLPSARRKRLLTISVVAVVVTVAGVLAIGHVMRQSGAVRTGEAQGARSGWWFISGPGQPTDFGALVDNTGDSSATVEGGQLISAPGYPAPRLVGIAIGTPKIAWAGRGWPIPQAQAPNRSPPAPLRPGKTWVYYSVTGSEVGTDYITLGVRLKYRQNGQEYTTDIWAEGVTCIRRSATSHEGSARCEADNRRALALADQRA